MKQIEFNENESGDVSTFRCRKCRFILAKTNNVIEHDVGAGQTAFEWRKRSMMGSAFFGDFHKEETVAPDTCSSVFLEPMSWMKGISEGQLDGQILCHKCESKLGSFNWVGE